MVRKTRRQTSRKVLEDQVFEALENFFVSDPSKLLFKSLALQKQCELSAHLIDDSNEEKASEEETSFNNKEQKSKEIKKKSRKLKLRKSKSLKSTSGLRDTLMRRQWSSSSCKERSSISKGQSESFLDEGCAWYPETFNLKEKKGEGRKSTENGMSKYAMSGEGLKDFVKKTEVFNSPKIIIEDMDKDVIADSSEPTEVAREFDGPHLSVDADVHCSDHSLSASSLDTIGTDVDFHSKETTRSKSLNFANWIEFIPEDNQACCASTKAKEICEKTRSSVNSETEAEKSDSVKTDEMETDAVFSDTENSVRAAVDRSGDLQSDKEGAQNVESGIKATTNGVDTSEIEIESSVEKTKEEMIPFKDYCKRYLLQPFKNIAVFLLVYFIVLLPQPVLDIYRIVKGQQETVEDLTDGIMSICSDAALTFFLLAITILFMWQNRKKRNIKQDSIAQQ